jgi:thiol:disulfide interchange protein DsbG
MTTTRRSILLLAALAGLTACKDAPAPSAGTQGAAAAPAAAPAAGEELSMETIASQAQGFSVGPAMSAKVAYVFFDPQCPHCAALWAASRPLKAARFVWLPVSIINANSTLQGAAILAAPDPVVAMDGHEASLRDKRGGILPQGDNTAQKEAVKRNTELFNKYKFQSVPVIVTKNASGAVVKREGALPTDALAAFLGL